MLTNNAGRKPEQVTKANPRAANRYGQIIEMIVPGEGKAANHAVLEHRWEMFLIAGPLDSGAKYGPGLSASGWTACPDNICFDAKGRMWIASDQGTAQPPESRFRSRNEAATTGLVPGTGTRPDRHMRVIEL